MQITRVKIYVRITSFREPLYMSGIQLTYSLPPISTVYGLLSAAAGRIITPIDTGVGYTFTANGRGEDLETIYELGENLVSKSNILIRELLFDCVLTLYMTNLEFEKIFRKPYYALLLGRSTDLAKVVEVKNIEVKKVDKIKCENTLVPYTANPESGTLIRCPSFFDENRRPHMIQKYYEIKESELSGDNLYEDTETGEGIYIHN